VKAVLVLKNPDKAGLPLSEKDLNPAVSVLDMVRTRMTGNARNQAETTRLSIRAAVFIMEVL
jgi:hypothetical protein